MLFKAQSTQDPPVLLLPAKLVFLLIMFTPGIMPVFYLVLFSAGFSDMHHGHNETVWN